MKAANGFKQNGFTRSSFAFHQQNFVKNTYSPPSRIYVIFALSVTFVPWHGEA